MSRYRKVDVRIWSDAKFRALSDDAKMLWLYLLTSPSMLAIPGVIVAGPAAISEELEWLPERFTEPFTELLRNGLVYGDLPGRLIWLPKAIKRNPPANPNAVKAWARCWDEVPDSPLKGEVWRALKPFAERFTERFAELFPEPICEPFEQRLPEQDRDRDTETEREMQRFPQPSLSGSDSTAPPPAGGHLGDTARALWSEYADERDRLRAEIAPTSLATARGPGAERPVLDLLRDGLDRDAIANTVANAVAEAEHKRSMRWLEPGALFTRRRVETVGGLSVPDFRREYLGGEAAKQSRVQPGNVVTGDLDKFHEEFSFD